MCPYRQAVINGFNNILHFLQKAEAEAYGTEEHRISLILFSGHGVSVVHNAQPVSKVQDLSESIYQPFRFTPLYDAIGTGIKLMEDYYRIARLATIKITVITDGIQNHKQAKFNKDEIRTAITNQLKDGWDIQYLGTADQKTMESTLKQAEELGIENRVLFDDSEDGVQKAFEGILRDLKEIQSDLPPPSPQTPTPPPQPQVPPTQQSEMPTPQYEYVLSPPLPQTSTSPPEPHVPLAKQFVIRPRILPPSQKPYIPQVWRSLDSIPVNYSDNCLRERNTIIHNGPDERHVNCFIGKIMTNV